MATRMPLGAAANSSLNCRTSFSKSSTFMTELPARQTGRSPPDTFERRLRQAAPRCLRARRRAGFGTRVLHYPQPPAIEPQTDDRLRRLRQLPRQPPPAEDVE